MKHRIAIGISALILVAFASPAGALSEAHEESFYDGLGNKLEERFEEEFYDGLGNKGKYSDPDYVGTQFEG